jgi:hypothetical protein
MNHTRPVLSSIFVGLALLALAGFVYALLQDTPGATEYLTGGLAALAIAEVLNYLDRIATRLDPVGEDAAHRLAEQARKDAAAKADADKHRAEVRQIALAMKDRQP